MGAGRRARVLVLLEKIIFVLVQVRGFPRILRRNRVVSLPLRPTTYSPYGGRHPFCDVHTELVLAPGVCSLAEFFGVLSGF